MACVFAGTIFPMLTMAWQYSFEARSYSLMLGSGAAALFCWQAAAETEGRRRFWPLAGISVAFAAALSSHYMGVLLAIPFGAGELVRSLERKRIDKPMWAAFLVPTPLVLFYPGLLASVRSWGFSGARPTINSLSGFYPEVLQHAIAPMVVASVAAAVFAGFREQGEQPSEAGFPLHELVALIGFFIAPLPFFLVGMLGQTVTFVPRYGLLCVIGAAGLMSWLLARVTRGRNRAAAAFALALGVWLAGARFREASTDLRPPLVQVENANPILVSALQEGLPVMVAQPHIFLQADFYLPAAWLQHAYYVADAKPEAQYRSQELVDRITFLVAQQFPIRSHIVHWSDFRRNSRFLLHTGIANGYSYDEWIFDRLLREGWRLTVRAHNSVEGLYEVNAPTMVSQR